MGRLKLTPYATGMVFLGEVPVPAKAKSGKRGELHRRGRFGSDGSSGGSFEGQGRWPRHPDTAPPTLPQGGPDRCPQGQPAFQWDRGDRFGEARLRFGEGASLMCTTCGCGTSAGLGAHGHSHMHHHDHDHAHGHDPVHHHRHSAPDAAAERRIAVEEALFAKNDRLAAGNRARLQRCGIAAFNLVSSPGAGKTSLLVRTLEDLGAAAPMAVIEGDQATDLDARRIQTTGTPVVQVNTGSGCHLDAEMIDGALDRLDLGGPWGPGVLFIENVGNLVCPAAFDLGEAAKVVVVSVTEGDDKPLKYPDMFAAAGLMVVTKTDLLAHVPASLDRLIANAVRVNPALEALAVSVQSGAGLAAWYDWIDVRRRGALPDRAETRRAEPAVHA